MKTIYRDYTRIFLSIFQEARLLTQLKKMRRSYHPNSMRILDCWRNENRVCFFTGFAKSVVLRLICCFLLLQISFITERPDETYTTLRHWFNISRLSRNAMVSSSFKLTFDDTLARLFRKIFNTS